MPRALIAAVFFCALIAGCSQNNVSENDGLKKYLDSAGVSGSFGLFDNGQGRFTIYNLHRFRDSAYVPAGSFDFVQSLIAVQTGVVWDDTAFIIGNAVPPKADSFRLMSSQVDMRPALCQQGMIRLKDAFQASCDEAFRLLSVKIGKDTLKKWTDSLGYGNKDLGGGQDGFWLNGRLKVTADEQLGLMKRLYFDQLPFSRHVQQVVRRMMSPEDNSNYQLHYKAARGVGPDGRSIGWVMGWIEENKNPYFFVLNLEAVSLAAYPDDKGLGILHNILRELGFLQGKK